jgi:penicillin-binding protein 1A
MAATPKKKAKKPAPKPKWPVVGLWLLVFSPLIGIVLLLVAAAFSDLPGFEELENPKSSLATEVLSADQKTLGRFYRQNRTNVSYEDISPHVIDALVSTEDERFYEHSGIDMESVARALFYMGKKGGGSTITQQLAKLLFTEPTDNFIERVFQKAQEWIIAIRLEKSYTKEEILTMYLNQYDFLNQAVGIRSAANIYFDKEPKDLSLNESAMLVGMLKNSSLFNPLRRAEMVTDRREVVLSQMVRNERLSPALYDSLRLLPLGLRYQKASHDEGLAPYFREIVRADITKLLNETDEDGNYLRVNPKDGEPYDLYEDGLKIYTTIDSRLQAYAEYGVQAHLKNSLQKAFDKYARKLKRPPFSNDIGQKDVDKLLLSAMKRSELYRVLKQEGKEMSEIEQIFNKPREMRIFDWQGYQDTVMTPMDSLLHYKRYLRAGMMSMDPRTGFVKAWVGGPDFKHFKYDHVRTGKRQVGSTFKPIVYATAMREGYSPCFEIPKVPTTFEKGTFGLTKDWTPQDSDRDYGYMATLKWGLANSVNTMTAWVMKQFGPEAVVQLAQDMGIESDLMAVPSLCLGVADLSVYEITAANAVFANQGVYVKPVLFTRIEDRAGNTIYDVTPETREALDPRTAAIMLEMMKGTVDGVYNKHKERAQGTAMRLRMDLDSRPYDGFSRDIKIACKTGTTQNQSDGWFIGMTPELVTGVWVGAEDRSVRFASLQLGMGTNMALPIWGYYMKEAYKDESLGLSKADFEKPAGLDISKELDCSNEEESIFGGDEDYEEDFGF